MVNARVVDRVKRAMRGFSSFVKGVFLTFCLLSLYEPLRVVLFAFIEALPLFNVTWLMGFILMRVAWRPPFWFPPLVETFRSLCGYTLRACASD